MTYKKIIEKIREKQGGMDKSNELTKYYDENGKVSHIICIYRWVENNDQITDVEIKGSDITSEDWRVVKEKHTNPYMELYKHNFD